jgi:hypothetical protein
VDWRTITIVSGGQTGADRAALDFAIEHGIPHEGWCPRGRLAEDGPIAARYQLRETPARRYSQRTEWNVRDSDATVVFSIARKAAGGTRLTIEIAQRLRKHCLHLSRDEMAASASGLPAAIAESSGQLAAFLAAHSTRRLNIAGPRASQERGIGEYVKQVLQAAMHAKESEAARPSRRSKL